MERTKNETRAIDTILAASRRLLARSQAKAKDWGGGVWRTTDDGEKIFIKDGEARGGGPAGPVLGGKETKPTRKPRAKPASDSKPVATEAKKKPRMATQEEIDYAIAMGTLNPKKGEDNKTKDHEAKPKNKPAAKKTKRDPKVEQWAASRFKDEGKARNFAEWFGDSKVVDDDGKPKMVFHGTANFEGKIFERSKLGTTTGADAAKLGFWFSDDTGVANDYSQTAGIKEANNLEMQAEEAFQSGDKERAKRLMRMAERIYTAPEGRGEATIPVYLAMQNPLVHDAKGTRNANLTDLADKAKKGGHDGLIIQGLVDSAGGYETPATHYLVFNSEEIKSAHGNQGSFSRKEKDITKSLYDMVGWEGSKAKSQQTR